MKNKVTTKYIPRISFYLFLFVTLIFAMPDNAQMPDNKILEMLDQIIIPEFKLEDVPFTNAIKYVEKLYAENVCDGKGIKIICSDGVLTNKSPIISTHLVNDSLFNVLCDLCDIYDYSYDIKDGAFYICTEYEKNNINTAALEKNKILISDETCKQVFSPYLSG